MDFELSEEQRAIVATVRDFVRRELVPHEDLVERLDAVPEELAREIRGKAIAAGLYAANFPAELGGGGLDVLGPADPCFPAEQHPAGLPGRPGGDVSAADGPR